MADLARLKNALLEEERPLFVVLDGAQFEDLPCKLLGKDLLHRPLYRDDSIGNKDRIRTTPQLVWLDGGRMSAATGGAGVASGRTDPEILGRTLEIIGKRPAAAFWVCPEGGEVLFRHLRIINMILFPYGDDGAVEADPPPTKPQTHDRVLFRHADANVLAQVAPAMGADNLGRLLGPATELHFAPDPEWGDDWVRIVPPGDRERNSGAIELQPNEVAAIERCRLIASRVRRAKYLRETCKRETAGVGDAAVAEHVKISEVTGRELGLVSEAAHSRWAFIMCKSNGRILNSPEALDRIARGPGRPDDRVKQFMADAIHWLETEAKAGARR